MLALLDNTVLSNFATVRRTDLLQGAFDEAATATQVLDEYRAGVLIGHVPLAPGVT